MLFFSSREDVEYMTPEWEGERMEDGRPKVSDDLLERMRKLTMEEVWGCAWGLSYEFQIETRLKATHSTRKPLVGRALTIQCLPTRPDLNKITKKESLTFGFEGDYNKSAVGRLVKNDVMVVDFFDKVTYGTYFGGNLSTAVANRTQGGGAVIWGGIRDIDQIQDIPNLQIYYRGTHPTAIRDYLMAGYNRPTKIGKALCLPGDVVFGSAGGVAFIPPHLAEQTVIDAEISHVKDIFGFLRLKEQKYTAAQIDQSPWPVNILADFKEWFANSEASKEYRHLEGELDKVIEEQKNGVNPRRHRSRNGLPWNESGA
jgi:regulator of RNase E activity RraA